MAYIIRRAELKHLIHYSILRCNHSKDVSKIGRVIRLMHYDLRIQDDAEEEHNSSNSGVTISAQKTFRMLNAVIDTKGDLLEEKKPR